MSDPNLREIACKTMIALAEGDFAKADANFHPDAQWWIIGQGDLSHSRVRELAEQTEGPAMLRQLNITGTVAEGNKVAVEARGHMEYPDGRLYCNRSEEHTSELQSLMRISYAVFCLTKKK